MSLNNVIIEGRLTKEPELKQTQSGTNFCNITVAVNDGVKDNKKTYFFNCTAWKGTAERICQFFTKGAAIAIVGKLIQNTYQAKDGTNRTNTEIFVQNVVFPEGSYKKNNNTQPQPQVQAQPTPAPAPAPTPQYQQTPTPVPQNGYQPQVQPQVEMQPQYEGFTEVELEDEDLPF